MAWLDTIRGEFRPERTDDLKPGVADLVGHVADWQYGWIIESGPYEGQWAMVPMEFAFPFGWTPLCDIRLV